MVNWAPGGKLNSPHGEVESCVLAEMPPGQYDLRFIPHGHDDGPVQSVKISARQWVEVPFQAP